MKKLLTAAAVVATLGMALPAAAQSWGGYGPRSGGFADGRGIEMRIERGVRNGSLTVTEARRLSRQLDQVRRLEWRFQRDGVVTGREARQLDQRYADLNSRLRIERRDGDVQRRGYGNGYGYNGYR